MSIPPSQPTVVIAGSLVEDLPVALFREIGRVIVAFAALQYNLSQVIYMLMRIDRQTGRISVREPRATERLGIILDLIQQRQLDVDLDLVALLKTLDDCQRGRDQLAHGTWVRHAGAIRLAISRGSSPPFGTKGKIKRVILPEAIPFEVDDCRSLLADIREAQAIVDKLVNELRPKLPPPSSLDTPIARSHPSGRAQHLQLDSRPRHPPDASPEKQRPRKLSSAQKRALREGAGA